MSTLRYRPGTPEDAYAAYRIFRLSIQVVYYQYRIVESLEPWDEATIARRWEHWRSLYQHLYESAENFWVAEQDGEMIGYSRSTMRAGVRELTELFLHPAHHAQGIGRELLARAFPANGARHRTIIATLDPRALALYVQSGVYPRHPLYTFSTIPKPVELVSDLVFEDLLQMPDHLAKLAEIDRHVLGHTRDVDHAWLLRDRRGIACMRAGRMVGYAYLGYEYHGPFALLEAHDFPALLAYAETQLAASGCAEFGVDVPMINQEAVKYLLGRKYRMAPFVAYHMSDAPLGRFENYIYTSPDFFV